MAKANEIDEWVSEWLRASKSRMSRTSADNLFVEYSYWVRLVRRTHTEYWSYHHHHYLNHHHHRHRHPHQHKHHVCVIIQRIKLFECWFVVWHSCVAFIQKLCFGLFHFRFFFFFEMHLLIFQSSCILIFGTHLFLLCDISSRYIHPQQSERWRTIYKITVLITAILFWVCLTNRIIFKWFSNEDPLNTHKNQ